jgi:hypothetical protein
VIWQLSSERDDLRIVGGVHLTTKKKNVEDHHNLVEIDYDNPETVLEALKGMDKPFLLTPTHPKMIDFTVNLVPFFGKGFAKDGLMRATERALDRVIQAVR